MSKNPPARVQALLAAIAMLLLLILAVQLYGLRYLNATYERLVPRSSNDVYRTIEDDIVPRLDKIDAER